ncbi:MAG: hypothetical protein A2096_17675 [Spirochaetes bacterium GWF1_41_5]|nr:MAG: hypothetical protein A2096_17675 [Spirochaetes bacterium GWF1_41_5]
MDLLVILAPVLSVSYCIIIIDLYKNVKIFAIDLYIKDICTTNSSNIAFFFDINFFGSPSVHYKNFNNQFINFFNKYLNIK